MLGTLVAVALTAVTFLLGAITGVMLERSLCERRVVRARIRAGWVNYSEQIREAERRSTN